MAHLVMVSVRDVKAGVFGTPFFSTNNATAIRSFSSEVQRQDPMNMLAKYPADFELWLLGSFEDSGPQVALEAQPVLLLRASDVVNQTA